MRNKLPNMLLASMLVLMCLAAAKPAAAQSSPAMPKVGDMAPDFKLSYVDGNEEKEISLSQYRGKKNVVLGFYIFAFTGG